MTNGLAIIDVHTSKRGGHFAEWQVIMTSSALPYFDTVALYCYGVDDKLIEFIKQKKSNKNHADLIMFDLKTTFNNTFTELSGPEKASRIIEHFSAYGGCSNLFLCNMWAFDFLDASHETTTRIGVPWVGIGSQSAFYRGCVTDAAKAETRLHSYMLQDAECRALLVWDIFVANSDKTGKLLALPNIASEVTKGCRVRLTEVPKTIGLIGTLYGYRGVDLGVELISLNSSMMLLLAGVAKQETWLPQTIVTVQSKANQIKLHDEWLSESKIDEYIQELDAFVVDAAQYPHPSAFALKALSAGRCLIAPRAPSWSNDVIESFGCGIIVDPSSCSNLKERLIEFYVSGGTKRCVEAYRQLNNDEFVATCFDAVWTRLLGKHTYSPRRKAERALGNRGQ